MSKQYYKLKNMMIMNNMIVTNMYTAVENLINNGGKVCFSAEADFSGYGNNEDLMNYDAEISISENRWIHVEVEFEDGSCYDTSFDKEAIEMEMKELGDDVDAEAFAESFIDNDLSDWMREELNDNGFCPGLNNAEYWGGE